MIYLYNMSRYLYNHGTIVITATVMGLVSAAWYDEPIYQRSRSFSRSPSEIYAGYNNYRSLPQERKTTVVYDASYQQYDPPPEQTFYYGVSQRPQPQRDVNGFSYDDLQPPRAAYGSGNGGAIIYDSQGSRRYVPTERDSINFNTPEYLDALEARMKAQERPNGGFASSNKGRYSRLNPNSQSQSISYPPPVEEPSYSFGSGTQGMDRYSSISRVNGGHRLSSWPGSRFSSFTTDNTGSNYQLFPPPPIAGVPATPTRLNPNSQSQSLSYPLPVEEPSDSFGSGTQGRDRYNSLSWVNGGHRFSSWPGRRFSSLTTDNTGSNDQLFPPPPIAEVPATPTSQGANTMGWFTVGPGKKLTPAPQGQGYLVANYMDTNGVPDRAKHGEVANSANPFSVTPPDENTYGGSSNRLGRMLPGGGRLGRAQSERNGKASAEAIADSQHSNPPNKAKPPSESPNPFSSIGGGLGGAQTGDGALDALLGLFGKITGGPDQNGPPKFDQLPPEDKLATTRPAPPFSMRPPAAAPPPPPPQDTEENKPGQQGGKRYFKIVDGQLVPAEKGEPGAIEGTLSYTTPGSKGGTKTDSRRRKPEPQSPVAQGGPEAQGVADGPVTPNGRRVGKKISSGREVIDGKVYESSRWVLTPEEQREMMAKVQGDTSKVGSFPTDPAPASQLRKYRGATENLGQMSFYVSAYKDRWNDELWHKQWYMHDYRTMDMPVMDMNVVPVWDMGYTGRGITVSVVDDGIMHGHPDLAANHDVKLSYDYTRDKPGSSPDLPLEEHDHGTKIASQIAMVAGNKMCGVGMAYEAKVVGCKIGIKGMEEISLAKALTHRLDVVDISSNSYSFKFKGNTMQHASKTTYKAFAKGVSEGRNGKGISYLFAAGNSKEDGGYCGANAFVNARYTIPVASVGQLGKAAKYSERCAAIMAAAYSSGDGLDERVVTVEMANNCNTTFGGTSAATPHATAIVALVLSAKTELGYRDIMHIITMGAEVAPLANNENTWKRNAAGFWVSDDFGFGLLNAKNMVLLAKSWKNVPKEKSCEVPFRIAKSSSKLSTGNTVTLNTNADGCSGDVKWIENIEIEVTIQYPYRGALSITLISQYGTASELMATRRQDNANGMREWIFRSVQHWGESPNGQWTLKVTANALAGLPALTGSIEKVILSFYGIAEDPPHKGLLPRKYAAFRLPDGRTSEDPLP